MRTHAWGRFPVGIRTPTLGSRYEPHFRDSLHGKPVGKERSTSKATERFEVGVTGRGERVHTVGTRVEVVKSDRQGVETYEKEGRVLTEKVSPRDRRPVGEGNGTQRKETPRIGRILVLYIDNHLKHLVFILGFEGFTDLPGGV